MVHVTRYCVIAMSYVLRLLNSKNPKILSYSSSGTMVLLGKYIIFLIYSFPAYVSTGSPVYSISPEYSSCADVESFVFHHKCFVILFSLYLIESVLCAQNKDV